MNYILQSKTGCCIRMVYLSPSAFLKLSACFFSPSNGPSFKFVATGCSLTGERTSCKDVVRETTAAGLGLDA